MYKIFATATILTILNAGCATTKSGIVETGPDSFMIAREAGSFGTIKIDSIRDAGEYCKEHGKALKVTGTQDATTGIGWQERAHSEVQFMCLNEGDSRLKGGPLVPITASPVDKVMDGK